MIDNPFAAERLLFTPAHPDRDAIGITFAFPNEYRVGITSLGYQIVWATLAMRSDVDVRRLFTDIGEPALDRPELLGFSLSWELDYVHLLDLLEQMDIPIYSRDRAGDRPLVFGGGPVLTANPEPFADFFDIILLGDGEELLGNFIDAYSEIRGASRTEKLRHLAQVPGIYIPSLYEVTYSDLDGAIASISPIDSAIPAVIRKQTYRGNTLSASSVVTERSAWPDIFMVEVVRSCPEMCRFCLASYLTLPFRVASLESSLIPAIEKGLTVTDRLGLLGASITQHPEFETLLDYIGQDRFDGVRLSIASVRTNTVTPKLAQTLARRDTKSITIAVESGSERLRKIVNKKLETAEITQAAIHAKAGGLKSLKLYGMVGIPGEEPEDVSQTVEMIKSIKQEVSGLRLTWGCSTFVPKSHTPFQWFGVDSQSEKKLKRLHKDLSSIGVDFRPESYNWSVIQALISRGDRRLCPLLELVRHYGDSVGSYKRAFKQLRGTLPPMEYYVNADYPLDQILPWHHLQTSLPIETLQKHLADAAQFFTQNGRSIRSPTLLSLTD